MKKILVIITGSIAAYKCVDFLRQLEEEFYKLDVIVTKSAKQFVTKLTLSSLLKAKLYDDDMFNEAEDPMLHINIAKDKDLIIVVPASADFISQLSIGSAHSLSLASVLASNAPIIIAPAMNPNMWNNMATQANIKTLRERNFIIIEPSNGKVACGDIGYGKLADEHSLLEIVNNTLGQDNLINKKLKNKKVIITLGSTREQIDPVRYVGNYSTGEQGLLIAEELRRQGCKVSIIAGYTTKEIPEYFSSIRAYTATDMLSASQSLLPADIFIGCAAICDFKPAKFSQQKIKKSDKKVSLDLVEAVDVIGSIGSITENRPSVVAGFALESSDFKENAMTKLKRKNLDIIVLNKTAEMLGDQKEFTVFSSRGAMDLGKLNKRKLACTLTTQIAYFI